MFSSAGELMGVGDDWVRRTVRASRVSFGAVTCHWTVCTFRLVKPLFLFFFNTNLFITKMLVPF